jgi:hypothetical protein
MAPYIKTNACTVLPLILHEKSVVTLHERRLLCYIKIRLCGVKLCAAQKVKINVKYVHVTVFCWKPPKGNIHELKL